METQEERETDKRKKRERESDGRREERLEMLQTDLNCVGGCRWGRVLPICQ